jgi:alpha-ketoglutarate-dependent taurine dioxygenase
MSTVRIEPIKPHIGGTVHVAKSHLLDDHTVTAVREALELRGVLVFPRIGVTDAEQLALTDKLGQRVNYNRKAPGSGAGGAEDVYTVTLDKKINFQPEYVLGTFFWHMAGGRPRHLGQLRLHAPRRALRRELRSQDAPHYHCRCGAGGLISTYALAPSAAA